MLRDRLPAASTASTRTLTLTESESGKNVTVRVESLNGRISVESWIGESFSRHAAATPAKPAVAMEQVAVAFQRFESPAAAARFKGAKYTYAAPTVMRLTVGDVIMVPVATIRGGEDVLREATVVELNATCTMNYLKTVGRIVKRAGC